MRDRAAHALERLHAGHLGRKHLDEMSTGEVRRVLIARALVNEPKALVLDEPSAGLDVVARHRFMEMVRDLARQGTTVILITHHVEEIIPEVSRVILLKGGRVLREGPKAEMLTPDLLGQAFGAAMRIDEDQGYFFARPAS
jgi:iron complex transport system ATP-binding protein